VLTDHEGRFVIDSVPPGRRRDVPHRTPSSRQVRIRRAGALDLSVPLQSYGSLRGSLRTDRGEPVPRFEVRYALQGSQQRRTGVASGADGQWELPWLPPGRYSLEILAGADSAQALVELAPGAHVTMDPLITKTAPSR
jgi:hypothetical protein